MKYWARNDRDKAELFADHLGGVFQPFSADPDNGEEADIDHFLQSPFQMSPPIKPFKPEEVKLMIQQGLKPRKAPGYDLITSEVLKELSATGLRTVTIMFNAILRLGFFPPQWKVAQIILIAKPGKPPDAVTSYRPISLLPVLSKLFEKLFLRRLRPWLIENNIVPDHQFGFREQHGTVEQVHRVVAEIGKCLEEKKYCSAAFLDVSQAFDRVWHKGLLFKLKKCLPHVFFTVLKSYLTGRYFQIKINSETTSLRPISAGVPQGSVSGSLLYLLFTADLPTSDGVTVATFADDTAVMASNHDAVTASRVLQTSLDEIQC